MKRNLFIMMILLCFTFVVGAQDQCCPMCGQKMELKQLTGSVIIEGDSFILKTSDNQMFFLGKNVKEESIGLKAGDQISVKGFERINKDGKKVFMVKELTLGDRTFIFMMPEGMHNNKKMDKHDKMGMKDKLK